MAGGTWDAQNKVRPGVYINTATKQKTLGAMGERGTAAFPAKLGWGPVKQILTLQAGEEIKEILGYELTDPEMLLVKEAFKRAKTVKLYRVNEGTKAQASLGDLTVQAVYPGKRGNSLSVSVEANIDDTAKTDIRTYLDGREVHRQTVGKAGDLKGNAWVEFIMPAKDAALTPAAAVFLKDGQDGEATYQDYMDFLNAIDSHEFHTLALPYDSKDSQTLKTLVAAQVKRWRDGEGRKIQAVMANFKEADGEGIISVKNGVILEDGTRLNAAQATVWTAAATASAGANESLTFQAYEGAVDADTRYTHQEVEQALRQGEFLFVANNGKAVVEQDINTFQTVTAKKGKHFAKNRVIRTLDGLANDSKRVYEQYYIGQMDNNADGRNLFKKELVQLFESYQRLNAIQDFDAQKDVSVEAGQDSDSIVVHIQVQPVDAIEKIYMQVEVE
ncbi:phage protein [Paenibacillus larvae subsp. larvae]|uniref:Phage protein n=1 Tax=Paenibacillus larvae subsp. larvae TaxID=147375 RepID=A0A2L1TXA4_9BACL|nr:phage tail sheath family protein [Paenibacillus larvae]AQT85889.1 phage tail sheath protein [Paenibacillus larvae subsp. pulvifaciens]AQZ45874.1 phage tail sheath protein [Paenibacillus larvae subsp. pulvifaciens]AVF25321.1 phage protein [Paenibacillus larvae subsp. larvae]AVF30098.1 phage protein [Paenibacillus larvae subsp. larvae]MBH0344602.1 phage-like element PBSX protein XkdK [Paenibacillus larvae]